MVVLAHWLVSSCQCSLSCLNHLFGLKYEFYRRIRSQLWLERSGLKNISEQVVKLQCLAVFPAPLLSPSAWFCLFSFSLSPQCCSNARRELISIVLCLKAVADNPACCWMCLITSAKDVNFSPAFYFGLFVCLSLCLQDYAKTSWPMFIKLGGGLKDGGGGGGGDPFNIGADPFNIVEKALFIFLAYIWLSVSSFFFRCTTRPVFMKLSGRVQHGSGTNSSESTDWLTAWEPTPPPRSSPYQTDVTSNVKASTSPPPLHPSTKYHDNRLCSVA